MVDTLEQLLSLEEVKTRKASVPAAFEETKRQTPNIPSNLYRCLLLCALGRYRCLLLLEAYPAMPFISCKLLEPDHAVSPFAGISRKHLWLKFHA
jgi:hypothetical protein